MDERVIMTGDSGDMLDLYVDPVKMPVVYERKIQCLLLSGMTREEAEVYLLKTPIPMELYYDIGRGLFAVESEAIESIPITNPYTGEEIPFIDD